MLAQPLTTERKGVHCEVFGCCNGGCIRSGVLATQALNTVLDSTWRHQLHRQSTALRLARRELRRGGGDEKMSETRCVSCKR